jgi:hypothetical protein
MLCPICNKPTNEQEYSKYCYNNTDSHYFTWIESGWTLIIHIDNLIYQATYSADECYMLIKGRQLPTNKPLEFIHVPVPNNTLQSIVPYIYKYNKLNIFS